MTLDELIARRTAYMQAEANILRSQEVTIDVDGGSRRYRFADLAEVRATIADLDNKIERLQNQSNRTRGVRYLRAR